MKNKNENKKHLILMIMFILMMLFMTACGTVPSYLAESATIEAGNVFTAENLLLESGHTAEFDRDFTSKYVTDGKAKMNQVGEFQVGVIVDGKKYKIKLYVTDNTAPKATAKDIKICQGTELLPEQCVQDVFDGTTVTYSFKTQPNTSVVGESTCVVVLTDAAGNSTEIAVNVKVVDVGEALEKEYFIEAGSEIPDVNDLLIYGKKGKYITSVEDINVDLIGSYEVAVEIDGKEYTTKLTIVDTVAPRADITSQLAYLGAAFPSAEAFVSNIVDAGPVKIYYETEQEPITKEATTVRIVLEDQGGNKQYYEASVVIAEDKVPPVFVSTPETLEVEIGGTIIWRADVIAEDNSGVVDIELDTTQVNFELEGEYAAFFVASDKAGNTSRKDVTVIVKEKSITQAMLDEILDGIIADIITEGMTDKEKVVAVYRYIANNIGYVNSGESNDLIKAAYLGLTTEKKGDCFTFCAIGLELFNRLGYDTMVVSRSPEGVEMARSTHKWVLVNLGTSEEPQWYHFDATPQPRAYRKPTYLMTAAQAAAYTNYRYDASEGKMPCYFTYDESLYPEVATKVLVDMGIDAKYYTY